MLQRRGARVQVGVTGKKKLLLEANAAVTRCLRRVFLRSSSNRVASSDVSDSISLSPSCICQQQSSFQYLGLNGWPR